MVKADITCVTHDDIKLEARMMERSIVKTTLCRDWLCVMAGQTPRARMTARMIQIPGQRQAFIAFLLTNRLGGRAAPRRTILLIKFWWGRGIFVRWSKPPDFIVEKFPKKRIKKTRCI
jgi:hypothetical protein